MDITKIQMVCLNHHRIKAIASIYIEDDFVVNHVKLVQVNSGELRAEFPKIESEEKHAHFFTPINSNAREFVESKLIDEYLIKTQYIDS